MPYIKISHANFGTSSPCKQLSHSTYCTLCAEIPLSQRMSKSMLESKTKTSTHYHHNVLGKLCMKFRITEFMGPRGTDTCYAAQKWTIIKVAVFFVPETRSICTRGSFDLFPQHCLLPEFTPAQHSNEVHVMSSYWKLYRS